MENKNHIRKRVQRYRAVESAMKKYTASQSNSPNDLVDPHGIEEASSSSSCHEMVRVENHGNCNDLVMNIDNESDVDFDSTDIDTNDKYQDCFSDYSNNSSDDDYYEHDDYFSFAEDSDDSLSSDEMNYSEVKTSEVNWDEEIEPRQDSYNKEDEIRTWAIKCRIKHEHVTKLLNILRRRLMPKLPKSAKTFFKTTTATYNISSMKDAKEIIGDFVYLGIESGLVACIDTNVHVSSTIMLQFNIDGVSPYNSSTKQLWPILCKVKFTPDIFTPFPVAMFYGDSKPGDMSEFMNDFVDEINKLQQNGLFLDNKKFEIKVAHIICDTPARAMVKQIKGHGGYGACERCEIHGESLRIEEKPASRRVIYAEVDCREKTDRSFRQQKHPEHHIGSSPLERITPPIDMIYSFPLDYMHLCCLGVTKKFYMIDLIFKKTIVKLRTNKRLQLHKRMEFLKPMIPDEFQRKCRPPLVNLKATELRFIALYAGPVIFKGILSPNLYNHFLLFHVAFRMLCTNEIAQRFNHYAKSYLKTYVTMFSTLFGEQSLVLNSHYLLHLADDVRINQCTLDEISAFPFENYLGSLRKDLRSANKPLQQICRRLHEQHSIERKPTIPKTLIMLKVKKTADGSTILIKIKYRNLILSAKSPNNLILLNNDKIVKIDNLGIYNHSEGEIEISGIEWLKKGTIFNYPTSSSHLQMWQLNDKPSENKIHCKLKDIRLKMMQMQVPRSESDSENIDINAVPLLHSSLRQCE